MSDSILTSTKKNLGLAADYTAFDQDVIMHINAVFSTLNQMGIGPAVGFAIEDSTPIWDNFLAGDLRLNNVKTYIYLRVRLLFDPPGTSYLITAMKEQVEELEWRMSITREGDAWVPSVSPEQPSYAPLIW